MKKNILDITGIFVGQAENINGLTGCSVILCEKPMVCGVDVRGGAPGTRETDLLDPINSVEKVNAVVLAGGSAFGLESTCGVVKFLEEKGIGVDTGICKVPIVVGAVLFDLGIGDYRCRPDIEMGYKASTIANNKILKQGNFGAGCGATVGKIKGMNYAMKSGIGSYSIKLENGLIVSALIAVNAFGDIYEKGEIIAGTLNDSKTNFENTYELMKKNINNSNFNITNTTIGVVATNAKLNKAGCKKISQMAHDGLAKTIFPIHTTYDGDTIFTLSSGEIDADISLIGSLATEVVEKSVINAIKHSEAIENFPSYKTIRSKI